MEDLTPKKNRNVYKFKDHSAFRQYNFFSMKETMKTLEDITLEEEAEDYKNEHSGDAEWQKHFAQFRPYFRTDRSAIISAYELSRCPDIDFLMDYIVKVLLPNPNFTQDRLTSSALFNIFDYFTGSRIDWSINNYRRRLRHAFGKAASDDDNDSEDNN